MSEETKPEEKKESNLDLSAELSEEGKALETPKAEENQESTQEDPITWAEMEQLKKFGGDAEKLAKSYLEIQKKMSSRKPAKDMTDEELIEHNKQFYGDLLEAKSALEGEMAEISEKTAQELGVATKLADAIAAKVQKTVAAKQVSQRIKKAEELMGDASVRQAVISAVKAEGGEYASQFGERLKTGKVSVEELTLLKNNGKIQVDADLGLEGEGRFGLRVCRERA